MRRPDYDRRVAITGLGVISPIGNDIPTVWHNLSHGVSGLAELTRFDVSRYEHKWGGEVKDFNAADWMDPEACSADRDRASTSASPRRSRRWPTRASRSPTRTARTSG